MGMAFYYKPISRWTKKRRLQGSLQKALHAIETALSDSDDEYCLSIHATYCVIIAGVSVKEALIEIGCVVTSLVVNWSLVGWLSRACTVAKRCILGL